MILTRLLVAHGCSYVKKFAVKTSGFDIMKHKLVQWWDVSEIWSMLFAILFGLDISDLDGQALNLDQIKAKCLKRRALKVRYPEIIPVIVAMLGAGVKATTEEYSQTRLSGDKMLSNAFNATERKDWVDADNSADRASKFKLV